MCVLALALSYMMKYASQVVQTLAIAHFGYLNTADLVKNVHTLKDCVLGQGRLGKGDAGS